MDGFHTKNIYMDQGNGIILIRITHSKGFHDVLVDKDIQDYLNQFKWYVINNFGTWYSYRLIGNHKVYMHREVMNTPDNMITDHINGNGLDNRKCNLRVCTKSENSRNRKLMSTNRSGYKGVSWDKKSNKWSSNIGNDGKMILLGKFDSVDAAAKAYDKKAKELFGEFARTNF